VREWQLKLVLGCSVDGPVYNPERLAVRITSPPRFWRHFRRLVVPNHARPEETKGRIKALDKFFGDRMLSYVSGETCRAYVAQRSTDAAARRELDDLRAAINFHRRENLQDKIPQ
jgi:hypothetical protein